MCNMRHMTFSSDKQHKIYFVKSLSVQYCHIIIKCADEITVAKGWGLSLSQMYRKKSGIAVFKSGLPIHALMQIVNCKQISQRHVCICYLHSCRHTVPRIIPQIYQTKYSSNRKLTSYLHVGWRPHCETLYKFCSLYLILNFVQLHRSD